MGEPSTELEIALEKFNENSRFPTSLDLEVEVIFELTRLCVFFSHILFTQNDEGNIWSARKPLCLYLCWHLSQR